MKRLYFWLYIVAVHLGLVYVFLSHSTRPLDFKSDVLRQPEEERIHKVMAPSTSEKQDSGKQPNSSHNKTILCMVLTIEQYHLTRALAVNRTWGRRCEGLRFCSNANTDVIPVLQSRYSSSRKSLVTDRLFNCLTKVWQDTSTTFDWLYIADDDTYAIIENLRHFLENYSPEDKHYFGMNFQMPKFIFAHGGSGYVLSKNSVREVIEKGLQNAAESRCVPFGHYHEFADINMAWCLNKLGITVKETADHRGHERFLKENPIKLLNNMTENELVFYGYRDIIVSPKRTWEALSEFSISFHYMTPGDMYFVDFLLYNLARGGKRAEDQHMINIPSKSTMAKEKAERVRYFNGRSTPFPVTRFSRSPLEVSTVISGSG